MQSRAAASSITAQAGSGAAGLLVRINPLDTAWALHDLAGVVLPGLAGIMLPKMHGAADLSRRRGYRGRIAIHPDQVAAINEAYSPSEADLAHARRIVDAFAAPPDAGALSLDGLMIDKPHLTQARRTRGLPAR